MAMMFRTFGLAAVLVLSLVASTGQSMAAEYRLRVVSVYDDAFLSQLKVGELYDGRSGPGLDQLAARLDQGEFPSGAMLYDRHVEPAPEHVAKAYGGTPIVAGVKFGGRRGELWDEARWDGTPGAVTVWVVTPSSRQPQEVRRLALQGLGPLKQFQPYQISYSPVPLEAVTIPSAFLRYAEARGDRVQTLLSRAIRLDNGIAALVALNDDRMFPDRVYLIVRQGEAATTYRAIFAWRNRETDRELPSGGDTRIR